MVYKKGESVWIKATVKTVFKKNLGVDCKGFSIWLDIEDCRPDEPVINLKIKAPITRPAQAESILKTTRKEAPPGWRLLGDEEERLSTDAYWSIGAGDWVVIGRRVHYANRDKWRAIRIIESGQDPIVLPFEPPDILNSMDVLK